MKNKSWIPVIITLLIAGCANYPLVDAAKSSYEEVKNDPDIVTQAPGPLQDVQEQLKIIENLKRNGASKELINHHAYIAQQKIAIAREIAVLNVMQNKLAEVEKDHQLILAEVQQAEIRAAEQMAEQARREAEQVRRRSEMLASQLGELEAERTRRGLVVNLSNVLFQTGNANIQPGAEANLLKLSRFLIEYPERTILIEGFTDNLGSAEVNQRLSEKRAEAVKRVLVANGVEPIRIKTRGYGEEYAIADNSTAAGRQQNRRVEVVISDEQGTITERQQIQ